MTSAEDDEISSEDTVEMEAATGPMMAMPASPGRNVREMASGLMLATLPPSAASSPVSQPAAAAGAVLL